MNHETVETMGKRNKPFTVDYTGFGWVLIKKGVFENMEYPWFAPKMQVFESGGVQDMCGDCLLYTSPSPRDATLSRMPSSA